MTEGNFAFVKICDFDETELTNLCFCILHGCVVGAPRRDDVSVFQLFDRVHRVERLRLLRISSGDLFVRVVAVLVAGDDRR